MFRGCMFNILITVFFFLRSSFLTKICLKLNTTCKRHCPPCFFFASILTTPIYDTDLLTVGSILLYRSHLCGVHLLSSCYSDTYLWVVLSFMVNFTCSSSFKMIRKAKHLGRFAFGSTCIRWSKMSMGLLPHTGTHFSMPGLNTGLSF